MNKLKEYYKERAFSLFGKRPHNGGRTTFAQLRIIPEYIVDLESGQVTGQVKHNDKVYLTVFVNVHSQTTVAKGSLIGIYKHTKPFKRKNYIEYMIDEAKFLIENEIADPKEDYRRNFN
ncbi:hypothetical protein [Sporosarcina sp. USHLN248]|uniref:hypothetical protein n=1 Tax=Sporosarcina sp. USHLN248 TaxID=3081300 RepID=UPI00301B058A